MNRLPVGESSAPVVAGLSLIPPPIRDRLQHVDVFIGRPNFAGLHDFPGYDGVAHCCWPFHLKRPADERITTVALPSRFERIYDRPEYRATAAVVHEFGHALHEVVDWFAVEEPVTKYACTNKWEAFAEAFAAWLCPVDYHVAQDALYARCPATVRLFRDLAAA